VKAKLKEQRTSQLCEAPGGQSAETGRTVRVVRADGPRVTDGRSEKGSRPSSSAPRIMDSLCPVLRRSASNWCRADGPRRPGGQSAKLLPAKNSWPNGSKRRRSRTRDDHEEPQANWLHADYPRLPDRLSARCEQTWEQQTESKNVSSLPSILPWISQTA
jgi:hypothetical protein